MFRLSECEPHNFFGDLSSAFQGQEQRSSPHKQLGVTCVEYLGLECSIGVGKIDGMAKIIEILSGHQVLTV